MMTPISYGLIALTILFTLFEQLLNKASNRQVGSFPSDLDAIACFRYTRAHHTEIILGLASALFAAVREWVRYHRPISASPPLWDYLSC